jgi:hypothetical protein
VLDLSKARLIASETDVLSDQDAGAAEALVAGKWAGKTWSQIRDMITRAVVNTDPDGAEKRREQAERDDARVRFFREHAGTAGLAGYGLPTDQALQANQNIAARARVYRKWGIPGTLDQLRVLAYLDLLNGTDARDRYPEGGTGPRGTGDARGDAPRDVGHGQDGADNADSAGGPASDGGAWDDADDDDDPDGLDDGPDDASDGDDPDDGGGEPGNGGPGNGAGDRGPHGGSGDGLAANVDLTVPLATLLGLAGRAGDARGLGALDPGLARRLAAEAAKNPRSVFRIILTNPDGQAVGFGQAIRRKQRRPGADQPPRPGQGPPGTLWDTTAAPGTRFAPAGPGPDGGHGTWTLALGDHNYTVTLYPIPQGECDHRYETAGYQPTAMLRRLVAVRDGECAMPVCVRHPKGCDWEHAVPWPAGRTCSCNGGYHCRHDHLIKQDPRWKVEQTLKGRRWTTPAGLTYTKGPKEYPA